MSIIDIANSFFQQGIKDEEFVMKLTQEHWGGIVIKSTKREDIYSHIDFFWKHNEMAEPIGFDVKGLRKNKRSGEFDETITWLELRAVNDRPGSLFGKAKYFAFITTKSIVYVERVKLIDFLKDKLNDNELIELSQKEEKFMNDDFIKKHNIKSDSHNLYEPHTRIYQDRETKQQIKRMDISVKVPMDELRKFAKQELVFF